MCLFSKYPSVSYEKLFPSFPLSCVGVMCMCVCVRAVCMCRHKFTCVPEVDVGSYPWFFWALFFEAVSKLSPGLTDVARLLWRPWARMKSWLIHSPRMRVVPVTWTSVSTEPKNWTISTAPAPPTADCSRLNRFSALVISVYLLRGRQRQQLSRYTANNDWNVYLRNPCAPGSGGARL